MPALGLGLYRSIGLAEGLEPLEDGLPVVECDRADVDAQMVVRAGFQRRPAAASIRCAARP